MDIGQWTQVLKQCSRKIQIHPDAVVPSVEEVVTHFASWTYSRFRHVQLAVLAGLGSGKGVVQGRESTKNFKNLKEAMA